MNDQTILIISDDVDLLQVASLRFKKAGAKVITAREDVWGLSKFFTRYPNRIILNEIIWGQPRAGP